MSIYTKTGDKGKTSLFEPNVSKRNRVSKSSVQIEAIGCVDEANSYLGVALTYCTNKEIIVCVKRIQKELFQIGAILSKAPLQLDKTAISLLEEQIDAFEELLPPLRNFIMPEGTKSATHFMYARSLVRKAERSIVKLTKTQTVPDEVLQYMNRLSDYLFTVFRIENKQKAVNEEIWIGKKKS